MNASSVIIRERKMSGNLSRYLAIKRHIKELENTMSGMNHDIAMKLQTVDTLQTQVADIAHEVKELEQQLKAMEDEFGGPQALGGVEVLEE